MTEKQQRPGREKKEDDVNLSQSPALKRARPTRNNPDRLVMASPVRKRGRPAGKLKRKLDFSENDQSSANEIDFEDGVQIEMGEGEGFSSDGDKDEILSSNNNVKPDHTSVSQTDGNESEPQPSTSSGFRGNPNPAKKQRTTLDGQEIRRMILHNDEFFEDLSRERQALKAQRSMTSESHSQGKQDTEQIISPSKTTVYVRALKKKRSNDDHRRSHNHDSSSESENFNTPLKFSDSDSDDDVIDQPRRKLPPPPPVAMEVGVAWARSP